MFTSRILDECRVWSNDFESTTIKRITYVTCCVISMIVVQLLVAALSILLAVVCRSTNPNRSIQALEECAFEPKVRHIQLLFRQTLFKPEISETLGLGFNIQRLVSSGLRLENCSYPSLSLDHWGSFQFSVSISKLRLTS